MVTCAKSVILYMIWSFDRVGSFKVHLFSVTFTYGISVLVDNTTFENVVGSRMDLVDSILQIEK